MVILGLLPGVTLAALGAALYTSRRTESRLLSLLYAALLCTTWMLLGTESLALVDSLAFGPVLGWWILGSALSLAWYAKERRHRHHAVSSRPKRLDWLEGSLLVVLAFFTLTALITAVLSPPNNYDTMTYHMARQVYWIQQANIEHYPSNSLRQLFMPPLAEFWGVNLYILAGNDRWANMVQWIAYVFGMVAIAQIARSLGASRRGQLIAACIGASNPMAWLNASSPKNDLLVALWVLCVAAFGLRVVRKRTCTWLDAMVIGWTVGLLALTKGTAAVFALPVCVIVGGAILWSERWRAVPIALVILLFSVLPCVGHFNRNYNMFGNPSGPVEPENEGTSLYTNQSHSAGDLTSNVIRNMTLHLGLPFEEWNTWLQETSYALHDALELDPNKEDITWKKMPYTVVYLPGSENNAGALAHFLLSLVIPFWAWRLVANEPDIQRKWLVRAWTFVPVVGFLLFCAVFRWQPWHARLHIPIFGLLAPLAGLCLGRMHAGAWGTALVVGFSVVWFIPSMPNVTRPFWGERNIFTTDRVEQRFSIRRQWLPGSKLMVDVAQAIDAREIGFHMGHNEYQHPLMQMMREQLGDGVRFVNVNAKAVSNPENTRYSPDMVIRTRTSWHELQVNESVYISAARYGIFVAYVPEERLSKAPDEHRAALFFGWRSMSGLRKPGHGVRLMARDTAVLRYRHFRRTDFAVSVTVTNPTNKPVTLSFMKKRQQLGKIILPPGATVSRNIRLPTRQGINTLTLRGERGLEFTVLRTVPWRPNRYAVPSTGG